MITHVGTSCPCGLHRVLGTHSGQGLIVECRHAPAGGVMIPRMRSTAARPQPQQQP